jgi:transcriptional regulator
MYIPDHFAMHDVEAMHRLMQAHPLGTVVIHTNAGLDANHVPFELHPNQGEHGVLTAHVARANPLWQQCQQGLDALVIFHGPAAYVSPNWYPSKHETHRLVPTWNYEVVHAYGRLSVQDNEKFVRGVVARLTRHHEASEAKPWKMGEAPPDYIDTMLQAIVGIEFTITRLEGKAKLSQNREDRDRLNAAQTLSELGQEALAQAMRQAQPPR